MHKRKGREAVFRAAREMGDNEVHFDNPFDDSLRKDFAALWRAVRLGGRQNVSPHELFPYAVRRSGKDFK